MDDLDSRLVSILRRNGYTLGRKIGQGYFRSAYEIQRINGSGERFVAKMYEPTDSNSVRHRINISKGLEGRETAILRELSHPNIIKIYDLLQERDLEVTIEERFNALSLEDKVRIQGPIRNAEFLRTIFTQVIASLQYLHLEKGILHRDIKPSNIVIGRQADVVKLIDFQTAKIIDEIQEAILPTHGATAYTHPEVINAILSGRKSRTSISSELYALGAVLYYVTAGHHLFEYKLAEYEEGMPIEIDHKPLRVVLREEQRKSTHINPQEHEDRLREKLAYFSTSFQELLLNLLSLERGAYAQLEPEETYEKLQREFDHALASPIVNLTERSIDGCQITKVALIERAVEMAKTYGKRFRQSIKHNEDGSEFEVYREIYFLDGRVGLLVTEGHLYESKDGLFQREYYFRTVDIDHVNAGLVDYHRVLAEERISGERIMKKDGDEGYFLSKFILSTSKDRYVFPQPYLDEVLATLKLRLSPI